MSPALVRRAPVIEAALLGVYNATLVRCAPSRLIRERILGDDLRWLIESEVDLVALGKCAAGLVAGAKPVLQIGRIFISAPRGYVEPVELAGIRGLELVEGSHPEVSDASFVAGERLVAFVERAKRPIVFLISGGSSACVELPLRPGFDEADLVAVNHALIRSGLPIRSINLVRRHLSAIKGGRLGALAPPGSLTMIYSDVSAGLESDVGSGPTLPDPSTNDEAASVLRSLDDSRCTEIAERLSSTAEAPRHSNASRTFLIADNARLRAEAADEAMHLGMAAEVMEDDLEGDVSGAVDRLMSKLETIPPGRLLIAGGEPTVTVFGTGVGGRCSELALRFAAACGESGVTASALFAGSDGVDGNTEAAGIVLSCRGRDPLDRASIEAALSNSDSFTLASRLGTPVRPGPTGNNLRDLYLMARI